MGRIRRVAPIIGIVRERGSGSIRLSRAGRPRIDYTLSAVDRQTLGAMLAEARADRLGGRLARDGRRRDAAALVPGRRDGDERRSARGRRGCGRSRSSPTAGRSCRRTRWGRHGPARTRRATPDPAGRVRVPEARAGGDRTIGGLYVGDASRSRARSA